MTRVTSEDVNPGGRYVFRKKEQSLSREREVSTKYLRKGNSTLGQNKGRERGVLCFNPSA